MKFKRKRKVAIGTIRIVKRFAFFPITGWVKTTSGTAYEKGETRWLETIYITQKRLECGGDEFSGCYDFWSNYEFVTRQEYELYCKSNK